MKHFRRYFFVFVVLFLAISVRADTLGQNQQFFISPQYDAQSRAAVNATLKHISDRAYFYVANDYWDGVNAIVHNQIIDQIRLLAQEFDSRIYPIETQFFGSEPNPGVDNDHRITILLTPLIENTGGYFDTANEYLRQNTAQSNEREMIYLNVNSLVNSKKMYPFLAHEFQHLISFNQKNKIRNVSDDIWLNELRSEYAPTLLGYNNIYDGSHLQRRARALVESPSDGLAEWKNLPADYGQIGMFGEYIAERWSPQVIAGTLKSNLIGFSSLVESLTKNGFSGTPLDIFRDWLITNLLNDSSANSKYSYSRVDLSNLRVEPTRIISNLGDNGPFVLSDQIKDWQGRWYDISQLTAGRNNVLKISFNSPSLASFYISFVVFGPDGKYSVYDFNPKPNFNTFYIADTGIKTSRIVVVPIKKDKLSGFTAEETTVPLTVSVERIASLPNNAILPTPLSQLLSSPLPMPLSVIEPKPQVQFADGSLIRARGDTKVYVIKGKWRRHIISPRIFSFYPGLLRFDKVSEVDSSVLNQYQESDLIRYGADQKVYVVKENGTRQWLNMSGEQFSAAGRIWGAIFEVNWSELNFYRIGSNIMK